jgi:hypothetical protein
VFSLSLSTASLNISPIGSSTSDHMSFANFFILLSVNVSHTHIPIVYRAIFGSSQIIVYGVLNRCFSVSISSHFSYNSSAYFCSFFSSDTETLSNDLRLFCRWIASGEYALLNDSNLTSFSNNHLLIGSSSFSFDIFISHVQSHLFSGHIGFLNNLSSLVKLSVPYITFPGFVISSDLRLSHSTKSGSFCSALSVR